MAIVFQIKNLKVSSPKSIKDHNQRQGHIRNENIDEALTQFNVDEWDETSFNNAKKEFKKSLEEQNKKHIQARKKNRVKTYTEKIKGKSLVSEIVISWGEQDKVKNYYETLNAAKEELRKILPTQFKERLIGASIHLDETRPHLHLTFHNFKKGKKTSLDSAFYSKSFENKNRLNKRQFTQIANKLSERLNSIEGNNIGKQAPFFSKNRSHLDPHTFKQVMENPKTSKYKAMKLEDYGVGIDKGATFPTNRELLEEMRKEVKERKRKIKASKSLEEAKEKLREASPDKKRSKHKEQTP